MNSNPATTASRLGCALDPAGFIRVTGNGVWTIPQVDRHFEELARIVGSVRSTGEPVRVMVDLSVAPVQPADIGARIAYWTDRIYGPQDRVAMVVSSSLLKLQVKRAVGRPNLEVFISVGAAHTWLNAYPCRLERTAR